MRRMEAGDLTVTLPVQNQDEIGYLTGAFNALVAQLGDADRQPGSPGHRPHRRA